MRLKIGFSPCPNDTYIFYALVHQAIDTEGIQFEPFISDVEVLNKKAYTQDLDVTKISYNAYLDLTFSHYLLDSGSALGRNCGPLLIANQKMSMEELTNCPIAIPGIHTTANFLLDFFLPFEAKKVVMPFDDIENAILRGDIPAGVIIHENRFTYAQKGLIKIEDLGSVWEASTGSPIPLGGIIARRHLGEKTALQVERLIKKSLEYADSHRQEVLKYVRQYAQEMDEIVMWQHIDLYVNDYSRSLAENGRSAIDRFFAEAAKSGRISKWNTPFMLQQL